MELGKALGITGTPSVMVSKGDGASNRLADVSFPSIQQAVDACWRAKATRGRASPSSGVVVETLGRAGAATARRAATRMPRRWAGGHVPIGSASSKQSAGFGLGSESPGADGVRDPELAASSSSSSASRSIGSPIRAATTRRGTGRWCPTEWTVARPTRPICARHLRPG